MPGYLGSQRNGERRGRGRHAETPRLAGEKQKKAGMETMPTFSLLPGLETVLCSREVEKWAGSTTTALS